MFRRGLFGQGMAAPRLQQALQLLGQGRYRDAGRVLGELADRAHDNGHPLRCAQLALQAGRAFWEAGETEQALARTRQATRQFIVGGRPGRAMRVAQNAAARLRSHGFEAQARGLEADVRSGLIEAGLDPAQVQREPVLQPRGTLPPTCSRCGGPLRPNEVEWLGPASAECPYCGSTITTLGQ